MILVSRLGSITYIGSSNLSYSALTHGLEWNLKVTIRENPEIVLKFENTFETLWNNIDLELYDDDRDNIRLSSALQKNTSPNVLSPYKLQPYPFQLEILEQLRAEREIHGRFRNLVVAATGTGKTLVAAFDFKRFKEANPNAKLLFVVHRKEILAQTQRTFRDVLGDQNFGELWQGSNVPDRFDSVFASVQTLRTQLDTYNLNEKSFDFIIVDEVHHIAAGSYRPLLNFFKPKIFLGLTATPERADGSDILTDFDNHIGSEIRLPEALMRGLLTPFQYFGISDSVDLTRILWTRGRYDQSQLSKELSTAMHAGEIVNACDRYLTRLDKVKALAFCVDKVHAAFMAAAFREHGLKAEHLTSDLNELDRENFRKRLEEGDLNYLFVVDIFNEGIDIPEIDTVLFLRPTESLTVFLQQLGRGLRLSGSKEALTVLDFVGNARPEYDFARKFRALIGKTNKPVLEEVENDFPHLPAGCAIVLEKTAREIILNNIRAATNFSRNEISKKMLKFKQDTDLELTMQNFVNFYNISPELIYKNDSWTRCLQKIGIVVPINEQFENQVKNLGRAILSCTSISYLKFVENILVNRVQFSGNDKLNRMLFHDLFGKQDKYSFESLVNFIDLFSGEKMYFKEVTNLISYCIANVRFIELDMGLGTLSPLKLHSRYTRSQILNGIGLDPIYREGVALNKELNIEVLFVTLQKSEDNFSSTTLYHDYAISQTQFHWESQNATSARSPKGQSYINHKTIGRKIILFVREYNETEEGTKMAFLNLGEVSYVSHTGDNPMSIIWDLNTPIPPSLWTNIAKYSVA